MKIQNIAYFVICALFLISCNERSGQKVDSKKPNVLFISVDDLNDYLGFMGDPNAITPHMDALAQRGVAFTNAHCQAPLCGPSRASIMTGIRPSSSGIYGMIKDDSLRTGSMANRDVTFLPEYFMEQGYNTYGVGKIFHAFAPDGVFEHAAGRFSGPRPNHSFGPKPENRMVWEGYAAENPENYGRTSTDWGPFPDSDAEMPDYQNTQWAINQLEENSDDRPFFLAVGYMRPHVPLHVPQKWFDLYPIEDIVLPPYKEDDFDDIPDIAKNEVAYLPMMPSTEWAIKTDNWKKIMQAYLACISFVDNEIGKLITAIDNSQYADNTIIVLWSDHGYRIGEKGTFAKQALWEMATKTPFVMSGPNIPMGRKIDAPVELLSIYPTLLDLCKLPVNAQNEGVNLLPLIQGESSNEEDYTALTTYGWSNHSLRTKDYRYIRYEDGSEELYDMRSDQNEFVNLADNPDYNKVKEAHKSMLPRSNKNWHKNSKYTFQPYFVEQKARLKREQKEL